VVNYLDKETVRIFTNIALDNKLCLQLIVGGQSISGKPFDEDAPGDVKDLSKQIDPNKEMIVYDVIVNYTKTNYSQFKFFVVDFSSIQGLSITDR
jgi:hypothetical protein